MEHTAEMLTISVKMINMVLMISYFDWIWRAGLTSGRGCREKGYFMNVYLGIDIGSTTVKMVAAGENEKTGCLEILYQKYYEDMYKKW